MKPGAKLAKNRDIMEIKVKWGLWAAFRASALTLFQMGKGELKLASGGQSCALPGEGMGWRGDGPNGANGANGPNGADGANWADGVDEADGANGVDAYGGG